MAVGWLRMEVGSAGWECVRWRQPIWTSLAVTGFSSTARDSETNRCVKKVYKPLYVYVLEKFFFIACDVRPF